ncbi:MAG: hypothetical protein ACRC1J_08930 [Sandaracinobacteroides sp.]
MKTAIWGFFGLLAALWSGFGWLLHGIAGSGSAAVMTVSRWLDIEPGNIQWLADGLAMAGGLAQGLVILFWLMGMGLLLMFGWMGSRAADGVEDMGRELGRELGRDGQVRGTGPVLDGEVQSRTVERERRLP